MSKSSNQPLKDFCRVLQSGSIGSVTAIDVTVNKLKEGKYTESVSDVDSVIANLILAKRHFEDAYNRMSLVIKECNDTEDDEPFNCKLRIISKDS